MVSREITVLLKEEEQYFDLTDNNQILGEENGTYIEKLEPFSELYSKSEYSFEEKNGRIYLVVVTSKDIQKYEMKTFV